MNNDNYHYIEFILWILCDFALENWSDEIDVIILGDEIGNDQIKTNQSKYKGESGNKLNKHEVKNWGETGYPIIIQFYTFAAWELIM